MRITLLLAAASSFLLSGLVLKPCDAAPIDVYIVAGQSNTESGFHSTQYPSLPASLLPEQVSLFNYKITVNTATAESPNFIQMQPRASGAPGNLYFGPDLSFAKAMEQRTGRPVAVIKAGVSGSGLKNRWLPALNDLYPWMLSKVNSALSQLSASGYQPQVSGFLWVQGENDAGFADRSVEYEANLATLATAVRTDLSVPQLPFVLNELSIQADKFYKEQLRTSQRAAAAADPHMYSFNIDDLDLKPEAIKQHLTGQSQVELGRRFADIFAPSGDYDDDGAVDGDDLAAWKLATGTTRVGDGNADSFSDGADFLLWQRQVAPAPPANFAVASVPEPSAIALAAIILLANFRSLRRLFRGAC